MSIFTKSGNLSSIDPAKMQLALDAQIRGFSPDFRPSPSLAQIAPRIGGNPHQPVVRAEFCPCLTSPNCPRNRDKRDAAHAKYTAGATILPQSAPFPPQIGHSTLTIIRRYHGEIGHFRGKYGGIVAASSRRNGTHKEEICHTTGFSQLQPKRDRCSQTIGSFPGNCPISRTNARATVIRSRVNNDPNGIDPPPQIADNGASQWNGQA